MQSIPRLLAFGLAGVAHVTYTCAAIRPITVEDVVSFATIGDPQTLQWDDEPAFVVLHREAGIFSPDGKHVAVVVRGGNPQQGTNDASLLVFRTTGLLHGARPEKIARFASASNNQPIAFVRWLADNETLVFAGTHGDQSPRVYRANFRTHALGELTAETAQQLSYYDITPSGEWLVVLHKRPYRPAAEDPECRRRGCLVASETLSGVQFGMSVGSPLLSVHNLRTGESKTLASPESADHAIESCDDVLNGEISADGRFAFWQCMLRGDRWLRPPHLVKVDLQTGAIVRLEPDTVQDESSAKDSNATGKLSTGVQLIVEQALSSPPMLIAMDTRSRTKRCVLDPNPWLSKRSLGRAEAISWKAKDGRAWRGGLYYPPDYKPGTRYPVVVQTHGFIAEQFSMDGRARLFAGRALTAQGIVVLQVGENVGDATGSPVEWPTVQAGYEGAVDHLDSLGIIDRNRVGIQGWSRSGPWMGYTLTHSSYQFAAGAFTDTADFGWWDFLWKGADRYYDSLYGATPFGEGLRVWLEHSPSFNLARVRTPMFMISNGVPGPWDWYVGLRRLNKPVEQWLQPDGEHDVFQVGQRLLMNHLLADWYRFWLKDEERTEPNALNHETAQSLNDQYTRWRELRKQQDAVLKQPRPPLLKWTATPVQSSDHEPSSH